jgi:hypothetical protein
VYKLLVGKPEKEKIQEISAQMGGKDDNKLSMLNLMSGHRKAAPVFMEHLLHFIDFSHTALCPPFSLHVY